MPVYSFIFQSICFQSLQFIQKKDPTYKDVKDETTWSMARFNDYINTHYAEDHGLGMEWVYTTLHVRKPKCSQLEKLWIFV